MNIVYANIKAIRESKKLRQEDMAIKLNMAKNNYSLLERAEIGLTVERLEEISKIFKMTPVEIYEFHLKEDKEKNDEQTIKSKLAIIRIYNSFQDSINFAIRTNRAPICFSYNEELNTTAMKFGELKEKITDDKFKELLMYQADFKHLKLMDSVVKFSADFDKKYDKLREKKGKS